MLRPNCGGRLRLPACAALALGALLVPVGGSAARNHGPATSVIVQIDGDGAAVRRIVADAGGTVTADLPIVSGIAALVPTSALETLQAAPGVRAVTPNEPVHVAETTSPSADPDLRSVVPDEVGVPRLWAEGYRGSGVNIALIDTGVSPVSDLAGRVVRVRDPQGTNSDVDCVNFSGETGCQDSYGHGTFVAGLIAGSGASSGGRFTGVAPDAGIVSVKIAGRDGSADVSKVLAAIQWVVSFADTYDIEVLNLSLGTDSTVSYRFDPLNFAVERAWRAGITVVVAASNRGPAARTISKPADDPLVLTVGAIDDRQTPDSSDDVVPDFSGRGPTAADGLAKPDVVAPGAHVISLRSPGSLVEQQAGTSETDPYRRGSGTSMSAGVVSGVVALLNDVDHKMKPDRLKFALMATAHRVASDDPLAVGAGLVDAYAAAFLAPAGLANTGVSSLSDGSGSLDGSRGRVIVASNCRGSESSSSCPLRGNSTAEQTAWDGAEYRTSTWDGGSWYASQWHRATLEGGSWYGGSWYGGSWYGGSWYGGSWYGGSWYGTAESTDYGTALLGSAWYGAWD